MISDQQTEILKAFLRSEKFTDENLIDDLVDHLSCEIESRLENGNVTFEEALEVAKQKILPNEPLQVQKDLEFLTTKTQNIMIKKIAFIGGYLSTVCLCISLVLVFNSSFSKKKLENMEIGLRMQYQDIDNKEFGTIYTDAYRKEQSQAYKQIILSQNLFLVSFIIFALTFLPYQFYHRYQKSQLELA
jgi:hypothetical protein